MKQGSKFHIKMLRDKGMSAATIARRTGVPLDKVLDVLITLDQEDWGLIPAGIGVSEPLGPEDLAE